jgi:hypothetical protein
MAWDVPIIYVHENGITINLISSLYKEALRCFVHYLLPGCSFYCSRLPHIQVSLSDSEICNTFETINFSQINVQGFGMASALADLHKWLLHGVHPGSHFWLLTMTHLKILQAPDILWQSGLVSEVDLGGFDVTRIASKKLSLVANVSFWSDFYSDSPRMVRLLVSLLHQIALRRVVPRPLT